MKKTIFGLVIGIMLCSSQSFAMSKPSWSLFSDTAYNMKEGSWNISAIGWANYGLTDRFQIGTNGLLYLFQIPNIYGKYSLIEETAEKPQISIGASLYYPLVSSTPISEDISIIMSRSLDGGNYILHGGVKLTTNINDSSVPSSNPVNSPGLGYKAGVIINKSDLTHFFLEAYFNWIPINRSSAIGAGADYFIDNKTVSFGGLFYASDSSDRRASFMPFANVQWTF